MDGRIFHLKNLLREELNRTWTIAEMASCLGLSVPHFQKLFKKQTGITPAVFLRELRLEKARWLLETTFIQIKQIGVQTGLANESHFCKYFKLKFGTTPTEYRKQIWDIKQSRSVAGYESQDQTKNNTF